MANKSVGYLTFSFGANMQGFNRAMSKASKRIKKFGSSMTNAGRTMTAGLTVPLVALGGTAVKLASDFAETEQKFNQVFSSIQGTASKVAATFKRDFGLSGKAAKQMLGDTGDLLVGFGFTEDSALDLSKQVNELAVDLASFTNFSGGSAGASKALTKLLVGETESAKALGIVIRQNTKDYKDRVAQIMKEQGVSELQAKALANLQIAMEQTQKAQGDYARTSGGFANQLRLLQAQFEDLAVEIGNALMPIAQKLMNLVKGGLKFWNGLSKGVKNTAIEIGVLAASIGPALLVLGQISKIAAVALTPIGAVIGGLVAAAVVIVKNWDYVKKVLVDVINYFIDLYNESIVFRTIVETIAFSFKQLWANVKFFANAGWSILKGMGMNIRNLFGGLGDIIKGIFTFDPETITKGQDAVKEGLANAFDPENNPELKQAVETLAEDTKENFATAWNNIKGKTKVKFISESDIDAATDKAGEFFNKLKQKFSGLFGVGTGGSASSDTKTDSKTSTQNLPKLPLAPPLEILEPPPTLMEQWKAFWKTWGDGWTNAISMVSTAVNSFSGLLSAMNQKDQRLMDNTRKKEEQILEDKIADRYADLENEVLTKSERDARIKELDEKAAQDRIDLDEKLSDKEKDIKIKMAKRDKKMALMGAIMNTAQGVTSALAMKPALAGIILAGVVGAMGAAQIGVIQSTPLPTFAQGGIVSGPTVGLMGEYAGASSNPEVIAPLSKLKSMMSSGQQTVQVVGRISGNDIIIASERAEFNRQRYV